MFRLPAEPARSSSSLALGALCVSLAACATQPYAYLNGARYDNRTALDRFDTVIVSIDGKSPARNYDVMVDPGPHHIVLQSRITGGIRVSELRALDLDVKPCTRYWFEARKANRLDVDFAPAVNYTEPIDGCPGGAAALAQ